MDVTDPLPIRASSKRGHTESNQPVDGLPMGSGPDSYFTDPVILRHLADLVAPYVCEGDLFVDFSCGKNEFAPLLVCKSLSYDIVTAAPGAVQKDWFTVRDVPVGALMGLNPPFGYQGKVARDFVEHALSFRPKFLFLILPNMRWRPPNYRVVHHEDLPEDAFYDPTTNKRFKEICATFTIFERSVGGIGIVELYTDRPRDT